MLRGQAHIKIEKGEYLSALNSFSHAFQVRACGAASQSAGLQRRPQVRVSTSVATAGTLQVDPKHFKSHVSLGVLLDSLGAHCSQTIQTASQCTASFHPCVALIPTISTLPGSIESEYQYPY